MQLCIFIFFFHKIYIYICIYKYLCTKIYDLLNITKNYKCYKKKKLKKGENESLVNAAQDRLMRLTTWRLVTSLYNKNFVDVKIN